ncbi:MAG: conjugal transfer protein TraR [Proteobacteria bacterium]|nr:MAG: conjugal transfer protein TraR [Pseudomonadota bacterium]
MTDHAEIRASLLRRMEALERRVGRIAEDLRHESEPVEKDFEEQATQRENEDVLGALDDAGRRELAAIRAALSRIDAGSYGTCRRCGEPIATERLRVLPTALDCVGCAA